jgi:multiple sugar transport system permease protein
MYEDGFKWWSLGLASAVAFALFALMLGCTALLLRATRGRMVAWSGA